MIDQVHVSTSNILSDDSCCCMNAQSCSHFRSRSHCNPSRHSDLGCRNAHEARSYLCILRAFRYHASLFEDYFAVGQMNFRCTRSWLQTDSCCTGFRSMCSRFRTHCRYRTQVHFQNSLVATSSSARASARCLPSPSASLQGGDRTAAFVGCSARV